MSLLRSCMLFASLALLAAVMTPRAIRADEPGKQSDKSQKTKNKKKKKDRDEAGDERRDLLSVTPEREPDTTTPARPANGSLFTDNAPVGSLFSDFKARRVGDLVFIDIAEESTASVSSSAKRSRDSGTLGGLTGAVGAIPFGGAGTAASVLGGLGSRTFEGKGETGRQSRLTARVAARVLEIMPNGDLRVEAQKMVKINKEDEILTLSGIVRSRDVSAENAVPTTMVGNLRVALNGKGVASADNAPGWLFRLFERIAPF